MPGVGRAQAPEEVLPARTPVTLTVNGRLLTGAYSAAEPRAGRLFLPVVPVAQALGDTARVDVAARTVEVRRSTGVLARLDATTGQVSENGAPTLVTGQMAEVVFPPDPNGLLLPAELVSALLDVAVVVDATQGTVRIDRGLPQLMVSDGARRSFAELHSAHYAYNASTGTLGKTGALAHNLQAQAEGRAHDGRLALHSTFVGRGDETLLEFQYGLLSYDRPNGQRVMLGDVSTGSDLTFLSSSVRGGWWRQPVGGLDVTAFAGRARSDAMPPASGLEDLPPRLRFDTSVVGSYLTLGRGALEGGRLTGSFGGLYFNGPARQGRLLSTGMQYGTERHQFRADLGVGTFDGTQPDGRSVSGTGILLDATESLTPVEALTLTAGFSHVGENVLSPQLNGFLRPLNLYSGGVSWRPHRWLSMATQGRYAERLDRLDQATDHDVTGTLAFNRGGRWPSLILTHSAGQQAETGPREFTLLNVTQLLGVVDLFSNFSRTRLGTAEPTLSMTLGAGKRFQTADVRAFQTFSTGNVQSGGFDWSTARFLSDRVGVSAGVGYSRANRELSSFARVGVQARLPGKQLLQLSYSQSARDGQVFLELRGPLFEAPQSRGAAGRSLETLSTVGTFSGRVYQDVDLDGRFDPAVDRPLKGVEVLFDGNNVVTTGAQGEYRMGNVEAGQHRVYLNLLTVRADLSLLTGSDQQVMLLPDRDAVVDFRLVRTGRATGQVWKDTNANGELDEGEEPVSDVRVVAGNRDTLSNSEGDFILGDLPQGTHTVLIDAKTLPEGLEPASGAVPVTITPPLETQGVRLPVRVKPVEVEIQEF